MIQAEKLKIGYKGATLAEDIGFLADGCECILLCGANGSGKTTLLKTLAGLRKPLSGTVDTDGETVLIPSSVPKVKGFSMMEFILSACFSETGMFGRADAKLRKAVHEASELLGIAHLLDKDISETSDGEFKKACIAPAFVRDAGNILLDEPTAFLDVDSRAAILTLLRHIAEERKTTVIFSSHDIAESLHVCTRIFGFTPEHAFLDSYTSSEDEILRKCFRSFQDRRQSLL